MDQSSLTTDTDTNVTTEASLSYEEPKLSKNADLEKHIIETISLNLIDIIKENFQNRNIIKKDKFYLSHIPSITLYDYINNLVDRTDMNISTLINEIIFIDTFCEKFNYTLCMNNIYLILFSSCLISIKFNDDVSIDLKNYAHIAGVSLNNLINLEYAFHSNLCFDLFVTEDLY